MPSLADLQRRLRQEESGATLIEVLVSAVLVAMIAVGVLKSIDAANAASGNNKARAIASNVAQQDQERLRAYRAKELSNARETTYRTVAGVKYTVESRAEWVTDGSGTRSCTSGDSRADYLKISSKVTWPVMRGASPIRATSLYAPPNGSFGEEGSLGVEVLDRTAAGVKGVDVEVAGPKNVGGITDERGCVFFGYLPQGNYRVTFAKPGYVDSNGNNVVVRDFGVQNETTQLQTIDYDLAGGLQVRVDTRRGSTAAPEPADTQYVTVGHSRLPSPGTRVFGSGTPAELFTMTNLFPFTSDYAVYSGNCPGANPASYGQTPKLVTVPPGGSAAVTVREPAVRFALHTRYGTALPTGTVVKLTAKAASCGGTTTFTTDASGWLVPASGPRRDPGVPFGVYDACATIRLGGVNYRATLSNQTIANPDGVLLTLDNLVTGMCP